MGNAVDKPVLSGVEVVKAARGWLGTRFHHQGRVKRAEGGLGGCDCLGLLVGVAVELGLRDRLGRELAGFDVRDYGHIPDGKRLQAALDALLVPVALEDMQVGDVLLMRFEQQPQHLAIVSDYAGDGAGDEGKGDGLVGGGLAIIHALAAARGVVEHRLDARWMERIVAVYRAVN